MSVWAPQNGAATLAGDRPAHGAVDAFPIGLLLLHAVRSPAPCRAARPQCSRVDPLGARLVAPLPRCLVGLRLLFPYDLSCQIPTKKFFKYALTCMNARSTYTYVLRPDRG